MIAALLSLALSVPSWADAPKAPAQLSAAEDGSPDAVFDGRPRRSPDGTEVLSDDKDIVLDVKHVDRHRECYEIPGTMADGLTGPHGDGAICGTVKAHTVTTYGDRQVVNIADRDAYKSAADERGAGIGALIGGLLGALGFLTVLALGPAGWAIGAGTIIVGALIGAGIGAAVEKKKAEDQPWTFNRDTPKRKVVTLDPES